jgi:hypothetical protein
VKSGFVVVVGNLGMLMYMVFLISLSTIVGVRNVTKQNQIDELYKTFTEKQWQLIEQIRGIPSKTETNRKNLLSKVFKKTIKISSRKGKSRDLQNWVSAQISELTGIAWGKDEEIASREMGQSGVDNRLSKRVLAMFPFSTECKNQEVWSLPMFIKQAKQNVLPNTNWIVFLKKSGYEEIAVLDALLFFKILKQCHTKKGKK